MTKTLAALLLLAACSKTDKPGANDPDMPDVPGTPSAQVIDASTDPVNTTTAEMEFWKRGDAACPDGAQLTGTPGQQVSCVLPDYKNHGPWATWYDGYLYEIGTMDQGQREGVFVGFHRNGQKHTEVGYHRNNLHGPWIQWFEDGKKQLEGAYRDGRPDGKFTAWSSSGKEVGSFTMKNGTGVYKSWHDNGKQSFEQEMKDGQVHGHYLSWHDNGQKATEAKYAHDKPVGKHTEWDASGNKTVEGQHDKGEYHGDWKYYDGPTGNIVRVDTYEHGSQVQTVDYQDGKPLRDKLPNQGQCKTDDGVRKAFQKATGGELSKEWGCIERSEHFPELILIGSFAHDRGCMGKSAFLDCKWNKTMPTSETLLARAGWKRAKAAAREKIAMDYLREVEITWDGSMSSDPDKPKTVSEKDGGVTITAWVNEPSGMRPGRTAHLTEYKFSANGALSVKVLKTIDTHD